jgi:hypothetical protein
LGSRDTLVRVQSDFRQEQALERIAPGLPMKPGKVERCEFEYRRHGTQTLIRQDANPRWVIMMLD